MLMPRSTARSIRISRSALLLISFALLPSFSQSQDNDPVLPDWNMFSRSAKVNIELLKPQGIQVWTKYKPHHFGFGVELYVNPTLDELGKCDLCRNVTAPIDGKFLIQDDTIAVKLGDTIRYRTVKDKVSGTKWYPWKTIVVDNQFLNQAENICAFQCDPSGHRATVNFLEQYIRNMLDSCDLPEQPSDHLFFPLPNAPALVGDPKRFVRARLYSVDLLRPLVDRVESVFVLQEGVGCKMQSVLDKLKILELGRDQLGVVDYDEVLFIPGPSPNL
ncbi:uncharacterized protein LOC6034908 [Culex quinquefasciatus]|nr:uncharacterized protein LOC6034908 [Culex quinquefasciatus]